MSLTGPKRKSPVCEFWEVLFDMINKLKMLIASDRDGDWEGDLQVVQDMMPIFVTYFGYMEKMRKRTLEHLVAHQ